MASDLKKTNSLTSEDLKVLNELWDHWEEVEYDRVRTMLKAYESNRNIESASSNLEIQTFPATISLISKAKLRKPRPRKKVAKKKAKKKGKTKSTSRGKFLRKASARQRREMQKLLESNPITSVFCIKIEFCKNQHNWGDGGIHTAIVILDSLISGSFAIPYNIPIANLVLYAVKNHALPLICNCDDY